jgi:DNA-binding MarR family transcriptional regulator
MDDMALLPADVLVAMKVAAHPDDSASVRQLGDELGMSKSAVAYSLRRLHALDLVKEREGGGRRINKLTMRDLLENAVRWIAPARVGDFELGLPTAHSAEVLARNLMGDADPLVMPLAHGPARGRAVSPLHRLAPRAAAKDAQLHRLLAVVDALRIGRARDRKVAAAELRAWL